MGDIAQQQGIQQLLYDAYVKLDEFAVFEAMIRGMKTINDMHEK